jgi:hypothetical protein
MPDGAQAPVDYLAFRPQDRGKPLAWMASDPIEEAVLLLESGGSDDRHAWC